MAKGKIIIALGGNALEREGVPATAQSQLAIVEQACGYLAEIVKQGYQIAVVHGNGPQVGRILLASEAARQLTPALPIDVCGAMSEGYIGYHIQQAMRKALRGTAQEYLPVVTVVTQVVVDAADLRFQNPTKPIGPFYSEAEARLLAEQKGYVMREDAGRGWRRVVASPVPRRIVEIESICGLWQSAIVVACGGGGVPVVEQEDGRLAGVEAVIDKDYAAELLAEQLDADVLLILTRPERVCLNYLLPDQIGLERMTVAEAERYMAEGHFAPGSMLPKVEAALCFVRGKPDKRAIIGPLFKAVEALEGRAGTLIIA
ncbi:MAG: carbamate kinase [Clostridia bacterium]|nr:carbamate kinase [Clostridia bacterium]